MSKKMETVSNKTKDEQYQVMFDKLKKFFNWSSGY